MRNPSALSFLFWFLIASSGALAGEQALEYQAVVHTTETHAVSIPGQQDHQTGVATFRGLAIFADGRVAGYWYSGSFDFVNGSGNFRGYALWTFDDHSRLEAAYVGEAKARADGGITFTGKHTDITGSGQYAGTHGSGIFNGERIDFLTEGGDTYIRGTLKLESAAE